MVHCYGDVMAAAELTTDKLFKLARDRARKSVICSFRPYLRADIGRVYTGPRVYERARQLAGKGAG